MNPGLYQKSQSIIGGLNSFTGRALWMMKNSLRSEKEQHKILVFSQEDSLGASVFLASKEKKYMYFIGNMLVYKHSSALQLEMQ